MKRITSVLAFILFLSLNVFAEGSNTETFHGTIYAITMNDKHFTDLHNQTFILIRKSDSSGIISGTISQIGKMPGTLHFSIPVTINNAVIETKEGTDVGKLKLKLGMSRKLTNKEMKGTISSHHLKFTIRVISKMLGIKVADASFTFESN